MCTLTLNTLWGKLNLKADVNGFGLQVLNYSRIHCCCCSWSCVLYQPVLSHTVVVHDLVFHISQFSHTLLLFMILCSISASSLIHWCCSWSCVLYQPVLSHTVVVDDLVFYISQFSHTLLLFMILCSISASSFTHWSRLCLMVWTIWSCFSGYLTRSSYKKERWVVV